MQMTTYGTLEGISLAGFLQMLQADKKDNISLEVINQEGKKGFIYFHEGTLHNALTSNNKADNAVIEMISWKNKICITIRNQCKKFKKTITTDLLALIVRASEF